MRTLAIECATEACSIALFEGDDLIAGEHRVLGRGHAEHLVPMIAALPEKGRAERVLVSRGPGSFTGVRIGVAVGGSLGIAWKAQVSGYPTLSLVGAMALSESEANAVTVCMTGGHGEWFVQDFARGGVPLGEFASLTPQSASERGGREMIAGSRAADLAALVGGNRQKIELLPDARMVNLLAAQVIGEDASPLYGRGPDARLPA